jgi:hypothetical protein
MATFWRNAEAEGLAKDLIAKHHPHLAEASIEYLFTDAPMKRAGRTLYGKAKKVGELLKHFAACDFVILLQDAQWSGFSQDQRKAAVDHELCHCGRNEEGEYFLAGHDIEEFQAIIERHGFWTQDIKDLAANVAVQLELLQEPQGG